MVYINRAADLCVKKSIETISTFALITKVGTTDKYPKQPLFSMHNFSAVCPSLLILSFFFTDTFSLLIETEMG
jgi:hypothetical protein